MVDGQRGKMNMMDKKIKGLKAKDKIRANMFPTIANTLNVLGVPWGRLTKSKLSTSILFAQGRNIAKTLKRKRMKSL